MILPARASARLPLLALAASLAAALGGCGAATVPLEAGPDDIVGVVTGPGGPEAGVWVIAETEDLPTKFARIVVTDDRGRYALPDLPDAEYRVWVRGYGLVDSPETVARPGGVLDLRAVPAPDAAAAAEYYPAAWWFSLMEVPPADAFPGTGPEGNGISEGIAVQADWLRRVNNLFDSDT